MTDKPEEGKYLHWLATRMGMQHGLSEEYAELLATRYVESWHGSLPAVNKNLTRFLARQVKVSVGPQGVKYYPDGMSLEEYEETI